MLLRISTIIQFQVSLRYYPPIKVYSLQEKGAAGWNILVETGIALGINLDKAEWARKVGNEFLG